MGSKVQVRIILWLSMLVITVSACKKKDDPDNGGAAGKVIFSIEHVVGNDVLVLNELVYTNAAGNQYLIADLMYFISDITFYTDGGSATTIGEWKDIFYIDEKIPSTKTIEFFDKIPAGTYDSIAFTFGISEEKNESFMFVNQPEVNMFWPKVLGGGYHYMMINGKWKNTSGDRQPFDFHLGIGQLYHGETHEVDSIYAFVQNYFRVSLPGSSFTISDAETVKFNLQMDVDEWFKNPSDFDFDYWGGAIMQNQQAMQVARENGRDVFSIRQVTGTTK